MPERGTHSDPGARRAARACIRWPPPNWPKHARHALQPRAEPAQQRTDERPAELRARPWHFQATPIGLRAAKRVCASRVSSAERRPWPCEWVNMPQALALRRSAHRCPQAERPRTAVQRHDGCVCPACGQRARTTISNSGTRSPMSLTHSAEVVLMSVDTTMISAPRAHRPLPRVGRMAGTAGPWLCGR